MKFTAAAATLALAAGVSAFSNSTGDVYVTEVVTAYTTYCPVATSVVANGKTYTVSEATTLTISDCPCTVTYPASSAVAAATAPAYVSSAIYSNGTVATAAVSGTAKASGAAAGTASGSAYPSQYTGGASANAVSGAAVAAFGLAAFFL